MEHISCLLNPLSCVQLWSRMNRITAHTEHTAHRCAVWMNRAGTPGAVEWASGRLSGGFISTPSSLLRCSPLILSLLFSVFINKPQSDECRLACCFLAADMVDGKYLSLLHSLIIELCSLRYTAIRKKLRKCGTFCPWD